MENFEMPSVREYRSTFATEKKGFDVWVKWQNRVRKKRKCP